MNWRAYIHTDPAILGGKPLIFQGLCPHGPLVCQPGLPAGKVVREDANQGHGYITVVEDAIIRQRAIPA